MNYKDVLKKIEPFMVLGVFLLLLFNAYTFNESIKIQKQVAETTGWNDEEVRCYCEKSQVIAMENAVLNGFDASNISWSKG